MTSVVGLLDNDTFLLLGLFDYLLIASLIKVFIKVNSTFLSTS
ncbi:hypothetical protein J2S19_004890 [Metabacillus malikii]|uniref:Uncharacterized protein n=1 Tax=Metabacillus malikii TaxID=1504265 RepID=A0ABT9ZMN8_9BACI|nr:hypothetical protein [Metabacillus malikii]